MYIEQPTTCPVCGTHETILVPVIHATEHPALKVCAHCLRALGQLYQRPDIEWIKVVAFESPDETLQFLYISDRDTELQAYIEASGRTVAHGDVYASDQGTAEVNSADPTNLFFKGSASRRVKQGDPAFRVTREMLTPYLPQLERMLGR
jgi:hypothetical protein